MSKMRGEDNDKFDKMRMAKRTEDGWDKMDQKTKMAFMKKMQGMREKADTLRKSNRNEDDEKRLKTDYYNRSAENRKEYDTGMKYERDFKSKAMSLVTKELGSKCMPNRMAEGNARGGRKDMQSKILGAGKSIVEGVLGGSSCGPGLCCGKAKKTGLYASEYYICGANASVMYEGMEFACLDGAKKMVAGATALLATAYMMA